MDTRDDRIANRLAKLERDNRWLKAVCIAGLVLIAAAAAPPQDESDQEPATQESQNLPAVPELPDLGEMPEFPGLQNVKRGPVVPLQPLVPLPILARPQVTPQIVKETPKQSQVLIALPKESREVELEVKRLIIVDDQGRRCGELSADGLVFHTPDGKELVSLSPEDASGSLLLTNQEGDQARLGGQSEYHLQFQTGTKTPVFLSYGARGGYLMMGGSKALRKPHDDDEALSNK